MRIRRPRLLILGGIAVLSVAGTGITDAVVVNTAEQRIVKAADCRLQATGPVTARLTDPFAGLRTLTGTLGTVRITADGVHRGGTDMNVNAVLFNVTTHGSTDGGTATATIPYSSLQTKLGSAGAFMKVGTDGTGLILTGVVGSMGLPVTVSTSVSTTATSLTITPTNLGVLGQSIPVSAVGTLPGGAGLAGSLKPHTVTLPSLPAGARLTGANADTAGLNLTLSIPHSAALGTSAGAGGPSTGAQPCTPAKV
ncbi:hypothetical protein ABIA32_005879 [Streptacidiphilus sp. MAP12-20]|uniref:LmeA family phospholipid-binding protein n=1 Tax=Streptacidiphilus sp. MAP12-20 TaxID=3156299 RepID=UPI0035182653